MRTSRCALLVIVLSIAAPALAQTSERHLGEALLTTATAIPRSPPPRKCTDSGTSQSGNGEIVVCGKGNADQRIPSTGDDPTSRVGVRNGELHAPQLDKGSCRGKLGCFIGGRVSPPPYIIDMKAIPEAPADSDADRIAKGQMAQP